VVTHAGAGSRFGADSHEAPKPAGMFADLKHLAGKRDTNVALDYHLRHGEVDKAFAEARPGHKARVGRVWRRALGERFPAYCASIWRRPLFASRQRSRFLGRKRLVGQNSGRERDSLIRPEISLIADLNSLQGRKKIPCSDGVGGPPATRHQGLSGILGEERCE
jgi:hypothetical protein